MINHAMFQRNGRAGYVLKPLALRNPNKEILTKHTKHTVDVEVISAQRLPRPKDSIGREILKGVVDPYVDVSLFVQDCAKTPFITETTPTHSPPNSANLMGSGAAQQASSATSSGKTIAMKTRVVKNNGFNPRWDEKMSLPYDCIGDMHDLAFVRFEVKEDGGNDDEPLAVYCVSLACLQQGKFTPPMA